MYPGTSAAQAIDARRRGEAGTRRVPRMVYWLGLTSLLIDVSTEMLTSVLPVFMFTLLGLSPLQVGALDGAFQGAAAATRLVAAWCADVLRNNQRVALIGYAASLLARALLLASLVGGALFALAALLLDRLGKGIRTAPRDALIAAHAEPGQTNAAFGLHRSMDAVGAFAGPALAAGLLWLWVDRYDILFTASLVFAALGVGVFALRVKNPVVPVQPPSAAVQRSSAPEPGGPGARAAGRWALLWSSAHYVRLLPVACSLALFTVSDGLLYLMLQQQLRLEAHHVPMLYVCTALVFLVSALPVARVADRWGSRGVFLSGYVLLGAAYAVVCAQLGPTPVQLALVVLLVGMHYAATDGILPALVVSALDAKVHTTGLALLASAVAVSRFASSLLFGGIWQAYSPAHAVGLFGLGLAVGLVAAVLLLPKPPTARAAQP
jgi:MFS family permease